MQRVRRGHCRLTHHSCQYSGTDVARFAIPVDERGLEHADTAGLLLRIASVSSEVVQPPTVERRLKGARGAIVEALKRRAPRTSRPYQANGHESLVSIVDRAPRLPMFSKVTCRWIRDKHSRTRYPLEYYVTLDAGSLRMRLLYSTEYWSGGSGVVNRGQPPDSPFPRCAMPLLIPPTCQLGSGNFMNSPRGTRMPTQTLCESRNFSCGNGEEIPRVLRLSTQAAC